MDLIQQKQCRKIECKRAFSWLCAHYDLFQELLNPHEALAVKGHLGELLQTLLDNELYPFAFIALYQCHRHLRIREIETAWFEMLDFAIDDFYLRKFMENAAERLKQNPDGSCMEQTELTTSTP